MKHAGRPRGNVTYWKKVLFPLSCNRIQLTFPIVALLLPPFPLRSSQNKGVEEKFDQNLKSRCENEVRPLKVFFPHQPSRNISFRDFLYLFKSEIFSHHSQYAGAQFKGMD